MIYWHHDQVMYHLAVIMCWAILVILLKGCLCKYSHVLLNPRDSVWEKCR